MSCEHRTVSAGSTPRDVCAHLVDAWYASTELWRQSVSNNALMLTNAHPTRPMVSESLSSRQNTRPNPHDHERLGCKQLQAAPRAPLRSQPSACL